MENDELVTNNKIGYQLEYVALREEILKRMELRTQILFGTLTLAGVLLGFASSNLLAILVYPIISSFLAMTWAQNDIGLKQVSKYIREHLENKIPGLDWEVYRYKGGRRMTRFGNLRFSILSFGGVFLITQFVSLLVVLPRYSTFTNIEWIVASIAVLFTIVTIIIIVIAIKRTER